MSFNPLSWFNKIKVAVSKEFVALFGQDAAQQVGNAIQVSLKSAIGAIAVSAVQAAASLTLDPATGKPITSAGKRDAAFASILSTAKSQGISASTSVINLLIEMAVQQMTKFGA